MNRTITRTTSASAFAGTRRRLLLGFGATALLAPLSATAEPAARGWDAFKSRFLMADGRIVDPENGSISHSEGQAWGMLLAEIHGDQEAFDRILRWTRGRLAIRPDRLLAWRYRPAPLNVVDDPNSATDGDLNYAWALLRAEARWPSRGYRSLAAGVARDIVTVATRQTEGRVLLLPGAWGFEEQEQLVINPSYYAFPALEALAAAFPHAAWPALIADGERLLNESRAGRWSLPPDWARIRRRGGAPEPLPGRGERFGYDAIRIPLWLAWSGRWTSPVLHACSRFWLDRAHPHLPAWVRLTTDGISPYPAGHGVESVMQLVAGRGALPRRAMPRRGLPGYYDSAISLLAEAASREGRPFEDEGTSPLSQAPAPSARVSRS